MSIRVNPDELYSKARNISNISADVMNISKEVQKAAYSAPSYEGQFGPKVKAMGNAAFSSGSRFSSNLKSASSDLSARATKFEIVDKILLKIKIPKPFMNLLLSSVINFSQEQEKNGWEWPETTEERRRREEEEERKRLEEAEKQWREKRDKNVEVIRNGNLKINYDVVEKDGKFVKEDFIREINGASDFRTDWERYNCPEPGTDAFSLFLLERYTDHDTPVRIIKNGENDYIVLIKGTNGDISDLENYFKSDMNGWGNNLAAFLGLRTGYEDEILKLILGVIPKGATIHLVGHSQGGIIANNCVADLLKMGYEVKDVVTFGSPPPLAYDQPAGVRCKYYVAQKDPVPLLGKVFMAVAYGIIPQKFTGDRDLNSFLHKIIASNQITAPLSGPVSSFVYAVTKAALIGTDLYLERGNIIDVIKKNIELKYESENIKHVQGNLDVNFYDDSRFDGHDRSGSYLQDETIRERDSRFDHNVEEMEIWGKLEKKEYKKGRVRRDATLGGSE